MKTKRRPRIAIALTILIVTAVLTIAAADAMTPADPETSCACQGPPIAGPTALTISPRP